MKRLLLGGLILLAVLALASGLRFPRLADRPMHGDEAVQAVKAGDLWMSGSIKYDPKAYHGPTLYYLTLPFIWISHATDFASTDEATFRMVPVIFGVAIVLLVLALGDGIGLGAAMVAAGLTAASPAMVFYSRYYIQETLLVFFTLSAIVAGWRYVRSGRRSWLYYLAVYVGLMFATKETAIIACASAALALLVVSRFRPSVLARMTPRLVAGPVAVGLLTAAACFSAFLAHPGGAVDAMRAPFNYADVAFGGGVHDHAWHYYLGKLLFTRPEPGGPWWSEGIILLLAAVGAGAAIRGTYIPAGGVPLARFITCYTAAMILAYSAIPYKTPWCMLSFLNGLIILAGIGTMALLQSVRGSARALVGLALVGAGAHLAWQAHRASFTFPADRRNPYAYAHPVMDVKRLAERVERLARLHPDGDGMLVRVIAADPWPLPWYLRRLANVGYWAEAPEEISAPVVITSAPVDRRLDRRFAATHHVQLYGLRPPVVLAMFVELGLWRRFVHGAGASDEAQEGP